MMLGRADQWERERSAQRKGRKENREMLSLVLYSTQLTVGDILIIKEICEFNVFLNKLEKIIMYKNINQIILCSFV